MSQAQVTMVSSKQSFKKNLHVSNDEYVVFLYKNNEHRTPQLMVCYEKNTEKHKKIPEGFLYLEVLGSLEQFLKRAGYEKKIPDLKKCLMPL